MKSNGGAITIGTVITSRSFSFAGFRRATTESVCGAKLLGPSFSRAPGCYKSWRKRGRLSGQRPVESTRVAGAKGRLVPGRDGRRAALSGIRWFELFPNVETMEFPPEAFCPVEDLDRVMEEMAAWVKDLESTDEHGEPVYPLVPVGPT